MSYPNGDAFQPQSGSRTGSISYPTTAMNYFQNEGLQQQQLQQQQQSQSATRMPYPMQHNLAWPTPGPSHSRPSPSIPSSLPQVITSDLPGDSIRNRNCILVDSPAESRSDSEDPAPGQGGLHSSSSKRKNTDNETESSRNKKKRNRAVLSCAPCKARKVGAS